VPCCNIHLSDQAWSDLLHFEFEKLSQALHPIEQYEFANKLCPINEAGSPYSMHSVIKKENTIWHPIEGVGLLH